MTTRSPGKPRDKVLFIRVSTEFHQRLKAAHQRDAPQMSEANYVRTILEDYIEEGEIMLEEGFS